MPSIRRVVPGFAVVLAVALVAVAISPHHARALEAYQDEPPVVQSVQSVQSAQSGPALTPREVFKLVSPSVFIVEALDAADEVTAFGSGVAVAPDQIVTNQHVVAGAIKLRVRQGENSWPAEVTHSNAEHDLVRLRVEGLTVQVVQVRLSSTLEVGEVVYAIGAPKGLELTFSDGLISALRDFSEGLVIQTTAAISSGSSGGGLFDDRGRLVGITTSMLLEGQNLNFAVPGDWVLALEDSPVLETAEAADDKAVGLALAWAIRGYEYGENDQYQKAVEAYREAIRRMPGYALAWLNLGVAYGQVGQYKEAIEASHEATRLKPDLAVAWSNLGLFYSKDGNYQESLEALRESIRLSPALAEAWFHLGLTYGNLGQVQDALDAYREAIRLKPDYADAWVNLGNTYGELGQSRKEIEAYLEAIRSKPDFAEAWFNLGFSYGRLGQFQKAMEALREAIRLKPDLAGAWYLLGLTYGDLGQYKEALEALREAIRLQPDDAEAWFGLGLIYSALGQRSKVMEVYEQLKALDKELADKFFNKVVLP